MFYRGNKGAGSANTPQWNWRYIIGDTAFASLAEVNYMESTAQERPYQKFIQDPNNRDRIHVVCTDGLPGVYNTSVRHFYMEWDAGTSAMKYYRSDGTEITDALPFNLESNCTMIYDFAVGGERAWIWDIRVDASGNPHVLFNRYPSTDAHDYYAARWTGSAWRVAKVCDGGPGLTSTSPYYSGGLCFDANNLDSICASVGDGALVGEGDWAMQEYRTADDGLSWSLHAVLDDSPGKKWRPYSPEGHDENLRFAWIAGGVYDGFLSSQYSGTTLRFAA